MRDGRVGNGYVQVTLLRMPVILTDEAYDLWLDPRLPEDGLDAH